MTDPIIGVDYGVEGGDKSCELRGHYTKDGTLVITHVALTPDV